MNRKELFSKLRNADSFCFDTETAATSTGNALTIHSLQLVGIAFAFAPGDACYLPVPEDYNEAIKLLEPFKEVFENPAITKIGHNLKYDINVLRRYCIMVQGPLWDTMIASYCYDPTAKHGLKELSRKLLGYQQVEIEDLIGKGKHQLSMRDIPVQEVATYACEDADQTLQLKLKLEPMLRERNLESLFHNIECPLIYVLADMEYIGVKVDVAVLNKLCKEAYSRMDTLHNQIKQLTGKEINFNSSAQLRVLLFDELGLKPIAKTQKGNYSVGKKSLKKLKDAHPVVKLILQYKETSSIIHTFLESLPSKVHLVTGRVHTSFQQARTATGRLSSSSPNLQNIPRSGEFGRLVRKAFVAGKDGYVLAAADFSQIEIRLMAVFSKDPFLLDAFKNGIDIHTATAARIFNVPVSDIGKDDNRRRIAKQINFGLNYGMSAQGLADSIWDATGNKVELAEAKDYMERYFDEFKGVTAFHREAIYLATLNDYCQTMFGRRRYLKDIYSGIPYKRRKAQRLAINGPVQGSAAEIIKIAMVNLHRELNQQGFVSKITLQVHDELILMVKESELDQVIPLVRDTMQNAVKLSIPLEVDIGTGQNWLDAH